MKRRKVYEGQPVKKKKGKWIIAIIIFFAIGIAGSILAPAEKKEKEETPIVVGQPVEIKNATYTVNSVEKTTRISQDLIYTDAKDIFVIIDLSITNNRDKMMSIDYTDFKLKNGDKTYNPSVGTANLMVEGSQTIYNGINPDSTMTGKVIFDINEEAANSDELVLTINNRQDIYLNK